jgi:single-strand DNA-binding protein
MAGNAQINFVGNLGGDPELRFTPSGAAVVNFSVGVAERKKDGDNWVDGETTWYRCNAWRTLAENIAESLTKGTRVVVTGTIKSRSYESRDGGKGVSWEVEVDSIGPDLRWATARVQRAERTQGGGGGGWDQGGQQQTRQPQGGGQYGGRPQGGGGRGAAAADDPWGQPPQGGGGGGYQGGFTDEPPF